MTNFQFLPLFAACTFIAMTRTPADIMLTDQAQARSTIYAPPRVMAADRLIPADATFMAKEEEMQRRCLRESVCDLAATLEKISGAKIEILQRMPEKGGSGVPILIGEYAKDWFGVPKQKTPYKQGWRMTVGGEGVGLQGESDESSSYAIYEILDRLGCRWFMPGAMGEVLPTLTTIQLPAGDFSGVPTTAYRSVWPAYADESFRRRNRMGGFMIQASHALEGYVTEEQRQQHPEWRAIIDGKPHKTRLKWSIPAVADAIADAIIAKLDKNYVPSVSLSPDDGASFDETEDRALDADDWDGPMNQVSITDRYIVLCNRIAERVTKKYPDVLFGFLAYVQYARPPVREKLHPNLVPVIAPINYCRAHAATDADLCPSRAEIRKIVEGWGKAAKQVAYYNYMFHLAEVTVPYPMMHQMREELPILYQNNVVFWQPETLPNFEEVLPGMWLSLRMAWNSHGDPQKILEGFFATFYGAAAGPMRKYWGVFDAAWTQSPEHAGSLWSYNRRFKPEVLQSARQAMDEALQAAGTTMEFQRVAIQDRALRQFERFMRMRTDLNEGRLATLNLQSIEWMGTQIGLANEYARNFAFSKVYWTPYTVGGEYFRLFVEQTYRDAARMAKEHKIIGEPLRQWKFSFLRDPGLQPGEAQRSFDGIKLGEANGWQKTDFNDASWKVTDVGMETWSDLGLTDAFGTMWYRQSVRVPILIPGKKIFLWISAVDEKASVFVNGNPIPFINAKGEKAESALGYAMPFTFDITEAVKPDADNQITIAGTRAFINELGTGGLLGPVYLFQEK